MRIELDIDDKLYQEARKRNLDIKTFLEVKLYEFIVGLESFGSVVRYSDIKEDFEKWLKSRVKPDTAAKYLRLLSPLETITVEELSRLWEETPDKRNFAKAARNLVNFLLEVGRIDETYARKLKSVLKIPKTNSDNNIPTDEDMKEAMLYFSMMRREYCLLAALLAFSGARLEHIVEMLKNFEQRYVVVKGDFARYRAEHFAKGNKHVYWIYFPVELLEQLQELDLRASVGTIKSNLRYMASSGRMVTAKYIRKWFNNILVKLRVDKDVRNFILGRPGEISRSVEADHYLELLDLADEEYPRIMREVKRRLNLGRLLAKSK